MDASRVIIHRANDSVSQYPLEAITPIIEAGYRNLEVDITVTGPQAFKFCHPSQQELDQATFRFDTLLFQRLEALGISFFIADLKCQYGEPIPIDLLRTIYDAFGSKVMFVAAQPKFLIAVHELGAPTGQVFRKHIPPELPFEPDYFVYDDYNNADYPIHKSIPYCLTVESGERYLAEGVPYVLLDLPTLQQ